MIDQCISCGRVHKTWGCIAEKEITWLRTLIDRIYKYGCLDDVEGETGDDLMKDVTQARDHLDEV